MHVNYIRHILVKGMNYLLVMGGTDFHLNVWYTAELKNVALYLVMRLGCNILCELKNIIENANHN